MANVTEALVCAFSVCVRFYASELSSMLHISCTLHLHTCCVYACSECSDKTVHTRLRLCCCNKLPKSRVLDQCDTCTILQNELSLKFKCTNERATPGKNFRQILYLPEISCHLKVLGLSPPVKYFYWLFQDGASFVDHLCYFFLVSLCFHARLFIDALWSPAGKGTSSWLSFVMSNCEVVTFPLVSWVRYGAWLYRFLIFVLFLTFTIEQLRWSDYMGVRAVCIWDSTRELSEFGNFRENLFSRIALLHIFGMFKHRD